jgi:peptide-methionine (S)-S-oxide reductase
LNRQGGDTGTQYRSGIYAHSEAQLTAAKSSKEKWQARFKAPIVTEIVKGLPCQRPLII